MILTLTQEEATEESWLQTLFKVLIRIDCNGFKAASPSNTKKMKFIQTRNKRIRHTNRTL